MINWFGPDSWGAPVCADTPRCDVPVDVACARCARTFGPRDSGITMPGSEGPVAFHLECHQFCETQLAAIREEVRTRLETFNGREQ